jgi:S1-C subfamily serine protease
MNWVKVVLLAFFFGIFGGIFATEILWPYFVERPLFLKYKIEIPQGYKIEKKEIRIQENTALKEAIDKVQKSSFFLKTQYKGKEISGSGFILTSDGLAITLADLVPWGGKFTFFVEGKPVHFQILKRDLKNNLALIKFEGENFSSSGFGDLEKLKLGERIFLVANFEKEKKIKILVDEGIVKSFDQDLIETSFQEDERILGSPLFNIDGELLGLNFINNHKVFAIPVEKIRKFSNL